jgi:hypothetical protein
VEHKKTPQRVSRTVPKKVCDGANGVIVSKNQEKTVPKKSLRNTNGIVFGS